MAKLALEKISKNFGVTQALDQLSLEVADGEFLVLLGPSGAGKTTTLKIIAGVEQPNSGRIYFDERLMNAVEPQKRNVAMAFESYALYPHYSVFDNLASPLRAPKVRMEKSKLQSRVQEVAGMLNIDMLLDRLPGQLSNGQKQRVSLGRALVRHPDVLLLDEPLSHLDAKLRHAMRTEFKALESAIQTTTLYVTHDYLEALSLGDRIAVINEGRLLQVSTPDEIYGAPVNIFVSTILGEPRINLIPCNVLHEGEQTRLVSDDKQLHIAAPAHLRTILTERGLTKAIVGLRPLHLHVAPGGEDDGATIQGQVYVYERLGTRGVLTVTVGKQQLTLITPIEMNFRIDEQVALHVESERILLFDPQSEENIAL